MFGLVTQSLFKDFLLGGQGTCIKMEREAFFLGRQSEGEYLGVWGAVSGFRGAAP